MVSRESEFSATTCQSDDMDAQLLRGQVRLYDLPPAELVWRSFSPRGYPDCSRKVNEMSKSYHSYLNESPNLITSVYTS